MTWKPGPDRYLKRPQRGEAGARRYYTIELVRDGISYERIFCRDEADRDRILVLLRQAGDIAGELARELDWWLLHGRFLAGNCDEKHKGCRRAAAALRRYNEWMKGKP